MMDATLDKFAEELHWCIGQLELGLQRQLPDSRQAAESMKLLKILRSNKAPMVKKRQVMRNAFGDYRKKIKEEEKKSLSGLRHSRFQPLGSTKTPVNSRFFKLSHSKQSTTLAGNDLDRNLGSLNLQSSAFEADISGSQTSAEFDCSSAEDFDHQVPCGSGGSSLTSNGTVLVQVYQAASTEGIQNSTGSAALPSSSSSPKGLFDATLCEAASSRAGGSHHTSHTNPTHLSTSDCSLTLVTNKGSGFKYEPSNNPFVFGFESPEDDDSAEILATGSEMSGSGAVSHSPGSGAVSHFSGPGAVSHLTELGCNRTDGSVYKYEKSETDFCFNFTAPEGQS